MIDINISADIIAMYAAVIATFSAIKVIYDILTDRHKIKLSYRTDVTIQNHSDYKANESLFCLEVVNTGKRVIKIVNVGYFTKDGMKNILTDSVYDLQNRILTDSNPSTSYFLPLKDVDTKQIWYLYALDGRNKTYKHHLTRLGRLRHIKVFFIRRKIKRKSTAKP